MSEGSVRELDWLLDKLSASVDGVQNAVILSPDGLPLGRSPGLSPDDADTLAALAAGAQALARAAGKKFGSGHVVQTMIELDAAILVKRVGQHMIADPRFPVRGTV